MSSLAPAFADPVLESQAVFRAVMNAMARPGCVQYLDCDLVPPPSLSAGAAAVALALFDYETLVWLDSPLAESAGAVQWLRFHTGAPLTDNPARADFALIADVSGLPDFGEFALGSPDYPDRSTTLILQVESLSSGERLDLSGPGIDGSQEMYAAPLPRNFAGRMAANRDLFPRGVDLLLVTEYAVAAIPRSARIAKGS
jgi:alpha-D-ribose 1-methylphosphonate 5-triphosphate synthase subunit PhnH